MRICRGETLIILDAVYEYHTRVLYKLSRGRGGKKPKIFSFSNYSNLWTEIQNNPNYAALHRRTFTTRGYRLNVFERFTRVNSAKNIVFRITAYAWAVFKGKGSVTIAVHCSKWPFCDRFDHRAFVSLMSIVVSRGKTNVPFSLVHQTVRLYNPRPFPARIPENSHNCSGRLGGWVSYGRLASEKISL